METRWSGIIGKWQRYLWQCDNEQDVSVYRLESHGIATHQKYKCQKSWNSTRSCQGELRGIWLRFEQTNSPEFGNMLRILRLWRCIRVARVWHRCRFDLPFVWQVWHIDWRFSFYLNKLNHLQCRESTVIFESSFFNEWCFQTKNNFHLMYLTVGDHAKQWDFLAWRKRKYRGC